MSSFKIELNDNGGWFPSTATTREGNCEDCPDWRSQSLVIHYVTPHGVEADLCVRHFELDQDVRVPARKPIATVLQSICSGPNRECRAAHKAGRSVHVIEEHSIVEPALVMPTNHYRTSAEGIEAIHEAYESAPMVRNDEDLLRYRAEKRAYRLPVGWVDPSMRKGIR